MLSYISLPSPRSSCCHLLLMTQVVFLRRGHSMFPSSFFSTTRGSKSGRVLQDQLDIKEYKHRTKSQGGWWNDASQREIIPLSFFSTRSRSGLMKYDLNCMKISVMCELSYGNRFVAIHYLFIFARLKSLIDRSINYHFTDQVRLLNKPRITMLTCRYKWVFLNRINTVPHVR